jgi:hypothetical protein
MNTTDFPTHPAPEQWADYLYGELPPDARASLDAHLRACADCQRQVSQWRETLGALDAWKLPERARPAEAFTRYTRWAVAAAAVLGLGWLGGRFSAPTAPDVETLRAGLLPALRQEVRQEFQQALDASEKRTADKLVDLAQTWTEVRNEDRQAMVALYQQAEQQRRTEQAALRRDLETVAVVAETAIAATQQRLDQLSANAAPPAGVGQP